MPDDTLEPTAGWLWRALVGPAAAITDPADRRRMRVLAGVALPLVAFAAVELASAPHLLRWRAGLALVGAVVAYATARGTSPVFPALALPATAALVPYHGLLVARVPLGPSEHTWALLVPLLAALALPTAWVATIGLAHVGLIALGTFSLPGAAALHGVPTVASVALVVTVTVIVASIREGQEEEVSARDAAIRTANRDLERTRALSENTVAAMADGLLVADPSRTIRAANPAFCEALGYAESELVGRPLEFVLVDEHDDTAIFEAPRTPAAGIFGIRTVEAVFRTRAGDEVPMSCKVTLLREPGEHDFGRIVLARDMRETLAVLAAAAAAEAERVKAAEIQGAHDRLLQTQAQLVQAAKLAAVGELAGAVAHEVNNPLAAALLATDLAEEALEGPSPQAEAALRQLDVVHHAILRCKRIIDGLLDFGRQSSGGAQDVDLIGVVGAMLELVSRKLQAGGAELVLDLPEPLPVRGDRNQLGQVVLNLVVNAAQALEGPGRIEIRGRAGEHEVRLSIRDEGVGIDPAVLKRIFEPFFTTKPRGRGTGLGLSISYGIVAEHEGRIEVESTPGAGSTFTLVLPRAAAGRP